MFRFNNHIVVFCAFCDKRFIFSSELETVTRDIYAVLIKRLEATSRRKISNKDKIDLRSYPSSRLLPTFTSESLDSETSRTSSPKPSSGALKSRTSIVYQAKKNPHFTRTILPQRANQGAESLKRKSGPTITTNKKLSRSKDSTLAASNQKNAKEPIIRSKSTKVPSPSKVASAKKVVEQKNVTSKQIKQTSKEIPKPLTRSQSLSSVGSNESIVSHGSDGSLSSLGKASKPSAQKQLAQTKTVADTKKNDGTITKVTTTKATKPGSEPLPKPKPRTRPIVKSEKKPQNTNTTGTSITASQSKDLSKLDRVASKPKDRGQVSTPKQKVLPQLRNSEKISSVNLKPKSDVNIQSSVKNVPNRKKIEYNLKSKETSDNIETTSEKTPKMNKSEVVSTQSSNVKTSLASRKALEKSHITSKESQVSPNSFVSQKSESKVIKSTKAEGVDRSATLSSSFKPRGLIGKPSGSESMISQPAKMKMTATKTKHGTKTRTTSLQAIGEMQPSGQMSDEIMSTSSKSDRVKDSIAASALRSEGLVGKKIANESDFGGTNRPTSELPKKFAVDELNDSAGKLSKSIARSASQITAKPSLEPTEPQIIVVSSGQLKSAVESEAAPDNVPTASEQVSKITKLETESTQPPDVRNNLGNRETLAKSSIMAKENEVSPDNGGEKSDQTESTTSKPTIAKDVDQPIAPAPTSIAKPSKQATSESQKAKIDVPSDNETKSLEPKTEIEEETKANSSEVSKLTFPSSVQHTGISDEKMIEKGRRIPQEDSNDARKVFISPSKEVTTTASFSQTRQVPQDTMIATTTNDRGEKSIKKENSIQDRARYLSPLKKESSISPIKSETKIANSKHEKATELATDSMEQQVQVKSESEQSKTPPRNDTTSTKFRDQADETTPKQKISENSHETKEATREVSSESSTTPADEGRKTSDTYRSVSKSDESIKSGIKDAPDKVKIKPEVKSRVPSVEVKTAYPVPKVTAPEVSSTRAPDIKSCSDGRKIVIESPISTKENDASSDSSISLKSDKLMTMSNGDKSKMPERSKIVSEHVTKETKVTTYENLSAHHSHLMSGLGGRKTVEESSTVTKKSETPPDSSVSQKSDGTLSNSDESRLAEGLDKSVVASVSESKENLDKTIQQARRKHRRRNLKSKVSRLTETIEGELSRAQQVASKLPPDKRRQAEIVIEEMEKNDDPGMSAKEAAIKKRRRWKLVETTHYLTMTTQERKKAERELESEESRHIIDEENKYSHETKLGRDGKRNTKKNRRSRKTTRESSQDSVSDRIVTGSKIRKRAKSIKGRKTTKSSKTRKRISTRRSLSRGQPRIVAVLHELEDPPRLRRSTRSRSSGKRANKRSVSRRGAKQTRVRKTVKGRARKTTRKTEYKITTQTLSRDNSKSGDISEQSNVSNHTTSTGSSSEPTSSSRNPRGSKITTKRRGIKRVKTSKRMNSSSPRAARRNRSRSSSLSSLDSSSSSDESLQPVRQPRSRLATLFKRYFRRRRQ